MSLTLEKRAAQPRVQVSKIFAGGLNIPLCCDRPEPRPELVSCIFILHCQLSPALFVHCRIPAVAALIHSSQKHTVSRHRDSDVYKSSKDNIADESNCNLDLFSVEIPEFYRKVSTKLTFLLSFKPPAPEIGMKISNANPNRYDSTA